jgi:hypothetical protein
MLSTHTAFKHLWRYAIAIGIPATLFAAIAMWPGAPSGEAGATVIGVDAVSDGSNTASSLGSIQSCTEVGVGDSVTVDLFVQNVTDIQGYDIRINFDPARIEVTSADPAYMVAGIGALAEPDGAGRYLVGNGASTSSSGSGVLARFTLQALASGLSPFTISMSPIPPTLSGPSGPIGNTNGDIYGYFDGPIVNAQIAIDQSCSGVTPAPTQTQPPAPTVSPTQAPTPSPTVGSTTGTPTFTPVPGTIPWGDANCMLGVTIDDAIAIAKLKSGVPITPIGTPCPNVGAEVVGGSIEVDWGDFNCDGQFNLADAIAIMRYLIGIATGAPAGCPSIATNYVSFP